MVEAATPQFKRPHHAGNRGGHKAGARD